MQDLQAVQHILDLTSYTATSFGIGEHDVRAYTDRQAGMSRMQRVGSQMLDVEVALLMVARAHRQDCRSSSCEMCGHLRGALVATVAGLQEARKAELERRLGLRSGAGDEAA